MKSGPDKNHFVNYREHNIMKREALLLCLIAVVLSITDCSKPTDPAKPSDPDKPQPTVSIACLTGEASYISGTSATLNGSAAINNASASNGNAYFYYSETLSDAGSLKSSGQRINAGSIPSSGGEFSASVSNLKEATTYHYVASVSIDVTESTGSVKTFKTAGTSVTVSTSDATDVTEFTATLNGRLTVEGTESPTIEVWFLYKDNSNSLDELTQNGSKVSATLNNDGSFSVSNPPLSYNCSYGYVACASVGDKTLYGEVKSFKTKPCPPEVVDLGLSVKWRSWNVGASKPEEYGRFFAWGDVIGQIWNGTSWSGDGFRNVPEFELDSKGNLKPGFDAARVALGANWRMPTKAELQELVDNSYQTWGSVNGVYGILFTGRKQGYTGKSIFIPAAGWVFMATHNYSGTYSYFWTSTLAQDESQHTFPMAWFFNSYSDGQSTNYVWYRRAYYGLSVRAVYVDSTSPEMGAEIIGWEEGEDIQY